jgi:hypothetical protein
VIQDAAGAESDVAGSATSDERGTSSQRIVRGPRRPTRVLLVAAMVGLAVGAVALVWPDGRTAPTPGEGREEGERGVSADAGDGLAQPARAAYTAAVQHFGRIHTFEYTGTVYAAGPSLLRPGPWLANELVVRGTVTFPTSSFGSLTWEVATATSDTFAVAETVTLGAEVWGRTAVLSEPGPTRIGTSPEASSMWLAGVPWAVVPATASGIDRPDAAVPERLGLAVLPDVLRSASGARDEAPDRSGRRVIRATIPEPVAFPLGGPAGNSVLAGAEVVVTLDRSGDVARIVLTLPPDVDPSLIVNVDIAAG